MRTSLQVIVGLLFSIIAVTFSASAEPNSLNSKIALNKLKVRVPASFQQMQLSEGKCTYIPEAVPGDFLVITPRKAKGFSFCTANAYCKIDGEVRPQRLYCSTDKTGRCPKDANICAVDKFAKYKDGSPQQDTK